MQGAVGAESVAHGVFGKQTNKQIEKTHKRGQAQTLKQMSLFCDLHKSTCLSVHFGLKGSRSLEVVIFPPPIRNKSREFSQELNHIPSACVLSIKLDVECVACSIFAETYTIP